jgi:hypothetical protein
MHIMIGGLWAKTGLLGRNYLHGIFRHTDIFLGIATCGINMLNDTWGQSIYRLAKPWCLSDG